MSSEDVHRRRSTRRSRSGTGIDSSVDRTEPSFTVVAINVARVLVVASIVYASWHYGAADSTALRNLTILLAAASVLMLACRKHYRVSSQKLPTLLFGLIVAWVGYAQFQSSAVSASIPFWSPGITEAHQQWGAAPIALLEQAAVDLGSSSSEIPLTSAGSVDPELTRQSLVPFLLAGVVTILSALLFKTAQSRTCFLLILIANAAALAFWGIIQKANRPDDILPGIKNTFSSGMPFASFIYKNAGAAALLPALVAIAALLYRHNTRGRSGRSQKNPWGNKSKLLETHNLALVSVGILLIVGLAASLSRGAWMAGTMGMIVVGLLCGITVRRRDHLLAAATAILGFIGLIGFVGIKEQISGRAGDVSIDRVAADSRWAQWVDGMATAIHHLPSGSGLGTYGASTLPHLSSPRSSWFAEAHNQYLEVFTESGLPGILMLFGGILWFAQCSWHLRSRRNDRERRSWGILGIGILVCGAVQCLVDFVLVIPANLLLYASMIGVVAATRLHRRPSASQGRKEDPKLSGTRWQPKMLAVCNVPAAWCLLALMFVTWAYALASRQLHSERVLARFSVERIDSLPDGSTLDRALAGLTEAIELHPTNSLLYLRRAHWHLIAYRAEVMKAAAEEQVEVDWNDTSIENLFALVQMHRGQERKSLLAGLRRTPTMRSTLTHGVTDLSHAISLSPLSPRGHLTAAAISPLVGMPSGPWLDSTAALIQTSPEMLFLNGLFALRSGQDELAVDQWAKSIQINQRYLDPIFEHATSELPILQIARHLVPASRPDLYVHLYRLTKAETDGAANRRPSGEEASVSDDIVQVLRNHPMIEAGPKHATLAQIQRIIGDEQEELRCWEAALREWARNPHYRLEYSQSLSRVGRNEEALKQVVLGKTLNPLDHRFDRLASQIRSRIRSSTH